ncbi:hypothetical protein ARUE_c17640 [Arthrobacter sp. Rue61a]|nr:hypothetical protein ARUE_c17640 [Arthrobacter sp. Rue61a]
MTTQNVHTLKQKPPLTRGYAVPEVGLERNSGPWKHWEVAEHAESGPVRWLYGRVRGGRCGHCPHLLLLIRRANSGGRITVHYGYTSDARTMPPGPTLTEQGAFIRFPPFEHPLCIVHEGT